jgi:hypothetical protein
VKIKRIKIGVLYSLVLLLVGCGQQNDSSQKSQYRDIGWEELEPHDETVQDKNPSLEVLELISDGSGSENYSDFQGLDNDYMGVPPQQYSSGVVAEMDGQSVRLPGFLVPVEFDAGNVVTEFFLVPYFGACFHKPPPPPNQTIYVKSAAPIKYESIYDPVWILGVIKTEQQGNDIASAAYSMDLHALKPFEY